MTAVYSKAMVLLLLIHCIVLISLFCGIFVWSLFCFSMLNIIYILQGNRGLVALLWLPVDVMLP